MRVLEKYKYEQKNLYYFVDFKIISNFALQTLKLLYFTCLRTMSSYPIRTFAENTRYAYKQERTHTV